MELGDDERCPESLQAQAHIWNHIFGFINSMALKCAVDLGIPEAINMQGGQPATLSQLVASLGIPTSKAPLVRRLMRLLTHSGFFTVQSMGDGEEAYLLNSYSEYLLRGNPHGVSSFLHGMLHNSLLLPWQSLGAWFRGNSPTAFRFSHGWSLWELASQMPDLNDMFNEAMASDSRLVMDVAIREHRELFTGLRSLVDVGGGNGAAAVALAEAFPHLKCTVLELPHVVASAPKSTAVDFIAGDMFQHVPRADAVFLKWVLHSLSDEQCVKLLKLCKEAIPTKEEGGKVIIIDMVVSEDLRRHEWKEAQLFFDVLMMTVTDGGKERSEDEWRKLCHDSGFGGYKINSPGLGLRAIIEFFP